MGSADECRRSSAILSLCFFFSLFFPAPSNSAPINRGIHLPFAVQPLPPFGQRMKTFSSPGGEAIHPPHCSKAIVTVAQSSRLTKRGAASPPSHPNSSQNGASRAAQLSMNIGVGQSVCFKMQNDESEGSPEKSQSDENSGERKEVFTESTFIVALTGRKTEREEAQNKRKFQRIETPEGSKVLHSITVVDLEQYHAITERYRFAIPELETRCICECESSSANCAADRYKYGRCENSEDDELVVDGGASSAEEKEKHGSGGGSGGRGGRSFYDPLQRNSVRRPYSAPTVCHRTFFANQPTGRHCSGKDASASTARLCCQLRFRPFQSRHFTALRLESAVTSALVQYSQWTWRDNGQTEENRTENGRQNWVELERRKVRIQLDGTMHSTVLDEESGLKLSMLGLSGANSAGAQLEPGVYFVENHSDGSLGEIVGQIAVNRITEHDFHKLGWFRLDEREQPFVQSGEVFLDKIHHARVDDCAEQRFRSVLDASYYVNGDNNETSQFRLPDPLSSVHKWIRSARVLDVYQRIALVRAREGVSLEVTLATKPGGDDNDGHPPRQNAIAFVHNSSRLDDFVAIMFIDRFSNSLLNITLFNASGVLNGFVRRLSDPEESEIDGFSINVPADGDNSSDQPKNILIRIKPYPLGSIHIVCLRPDDAEVSLELCRPVQTVYHELEMNTVKNEWSDCRSDALMLASDIFGYFVALLVLYFVVVKIGIPLLACCCMSSPCRFGCPSVPSLGKDQKK
uniref:HAP2-GCS1 domain-containing protein n=1 Tax=Globodera pallida TaxID=36090 RepID=A0A183C0X9_GLOPA